MSGLGRPLDKALCAEAGFDLHLLKPVAPSVLEELVLSLRGTRALAQRLHDLSREQLVACRDLALARLEMAGWFVQLARTMPETAARSLNTAGKAHDDITRMLSSIRWPDEDRFELERQLAVLRKMLRRQISDP